VTILPLLALSGALQAGPLPGVVSVRAHGAVGDGVADDTDAFQAAIDEAARTGAAVLVEPVEPGRGYVLTHTVALKRGVSLIGSLAGMPFIAWEGVPRGIQTGPVILARPRKEDYAGERRAPLFRLEGGNTLRGLYILYDQQPWPSDEEFEAPGSPYRYASLDELVGRFIPEHVAPCGPTVEVQAGVASTTIEDITCARYYDFLYTRAGGKIVVSRCYLFGYGRAFALREAKDVVRISEIHIVPNVEGPISWQHAKLHAAITASPENVALDFGSVDGYSVADVAVFLTHTGVRLGASETHPFRDPVTGEKVSFPWGAGPWGSMHNVKLDNCVVGLDCITGTILPNQMTNVMVHSSIAAADTFPAAGGAVSRQAAFVVEPGFAGATLQLANLSLSSFAPTRVVATGKMVEQANGRAFLVDCPGYPDKVDYASRAQANIEVFGLVVSNIPETHLLAATAGTTASVRVRGFVHNGVPKEDCVLR
jgi:Pectate lyase superfamily protein